MVDREGGREGSIEGDRVRQREGLDRVAERERGSKGAEKDAESKI